MARLKIDSPWQLTEVLPSCRGPEEAMKENAEIEKGNRLDQVLDRVRCLLREAGIESWSYEAWALLEWKLGIRRGDYYMDPGRLLSEDQEGILLQAARERTGRKPLQYMMGECEFMGYSFLVDERVLIPRQDTELLVETALDRIRPCCKSKRQVGVLDLCTGSGAIGISVKLMCPEAGVTISDISPHALAVARENWERLRKESGIISETRDGSDSGFRIVESDLFDRIPEKFDFILSNPPYIPTEEIERLMPEVRDYEPRLALDGESDGLKFYQQICSQAGQHLFKGGCLIMEIGADQGEAVSRMMTHQGFEQVEVRKDLAGLDRLVTGYYGID